MNEIQKAKLAEWKKLLADGDGEIRPKDFLNNAKKVGSAFHDDYVWDAKEAEQEYYRRRTADLILRYSTLFNTETARQRLHSVRPMLPGLRKVERVYRKSSVISDEPEELDQVKASIWSKLRRVTRDMFDFKESLPEFREILNFLLPRMQNAKPSIHRKQKIKA